MIILVPFIKKIAKFSLALCFALNSGFCFGVEDAEQPVYVKADKVDFDHNTGIATYIGHVVVTQGSRLLLSEMLTIKRDNNNRIKVITATGHPATFKAQPNPHKSISSGRANIIKYYPQQDQADLLDDASLTQNGDTIQGPKLNYNFVTGNLKSTSSDTQRATFIFQAKRKP